MLQESVTRPTPVNMELSRSALYLVVLVVLIPPWSSLTAQSLGEQLVRPASVVTMRGQLLHADSSVLNVASARVAGGDVYMRTSGIRAHDVKAPLVPSIVSLGQQEDSSHRLRHIAVGGAIGAAAGLVVGAAAGLLQDSRNQDGMIPATPFFAVEGLGLGLIVGLAIGAFAR